MRVAVIKVGGSSAVTLMTLLLLLCACGPVSLASEFKSFPTFARISFCWPLGILVFARSSLSINSKASMEVKSSFHGVIGNFIPSGPDKFQFYSNILFTQTLDIIFYLVDMHEFLQPNYYA